MMEDKNRVNDNELTAVTGGAATKASAPRFQVGDKVTLIVYPEFGIGTIVNVYMGGTGWNCTARFDSGIIDASDIEFIPA
ncbi:MAG: hypothetical protein II842_12830 [Butyrivibrio sp.]|nr:hypothetical protein [Butyrivibrio sp.]